jgi:hypothetical protein
MIAGALGTHKVAFDVWGDAVNTAKHMATYGLPGRVHVPLPPARHSAMRSASSPAHRSATGLFQWVRDQPSIWRGVHPRSGAYLPYVSRWRLEVLSNLLTLLASPTGFEPVLPP